MGRNMSEPTPPTPEPARSFAHKHLALTRGQRGVLVVLLLGLVGSGTVRYAMNPSRVPDPQPEQGDRFIELADRINPNTADWQTLAILPGIGERKAQDIIAKRDELAKRRTPAFRTPEDLYMVDGIGSATVDKLKPYLDFTRGQK